MPAAIRLSTNKALRTSPDVQRSSASGLRMPSIDQPAQLVDADADPLGRLDHLVSLHRSTLAVPWRSTPASDSGTNSAWACPYAWWRQRHGRGHHAAGLVERAQHGDRESFGVLADASMPGCTTSPSSCSRIGDLAEDAIQEALIVAWRDLRALRDPDRFDAWLNRILVRSVYRLANHERRQVGPRLFTPIGDATTPDPAPAFEDRDAIDRGFRRLKAEYRAVLVVHPLSRAVRRRSAESSGAGRDGQVSLHRATAAMRAELDADARTAASRHWSDPMTERTDLRSAMSAYLEARSTSHVPDGLRDGPLLGSRRRVSDRAGSTSSGGCPSRVTSGLARTARIAVLIAAVLLLAFAVALGIFIGSRHRLPPPLGLAKPVSSRSS